MTDRDLLRDPPDWLVEAVAIHFAYGGLVNKHDLWGELDRRDKVDYLDDARAALKAAYEAIVEHG